MPIWKTKYGWRTRVEVNGQKHYGPTFKYKAQAQEWCQEEKAHQKSLEPSNTSILSLADRYLDDVQANQTYKTYMEKRGALQRLVSAVGDVEPGQVTPIQVAELLNQRARVSNNASNKDRKNIKAFYSWLRDYYGLMHDPTAPIKKKAYTKKARRLIPVADIFRIIMAAPMPEKALMACYWHTLARKGEILRLSWADDVNLEQRWIRLGTRKTRDGSMDYESLWINDDLYGVLAELWRKKDLSSPYLFPTYYQPDETGNNWKGEQRADRLLRRLCQEAEVERFGFHDIRHSAAKYLADMQKVGSRRVQQVLRHHRLGTTEIYLEGHYTDTRSTLELLEESSQKSSQKEKKGVSRIS